MAMKPAILLMLLLATLTGCKKDTHPCKIALAAEMGIPVKDIDASDSTACYFMQNILDKHDQQARNAVCRAELTRKVYGDNKENPPQVLALQEPCLTLAEMNEVGNTTQCYNAFKKLTHNKHAVPTDLNRCQEYIQQSRLK